MHFLQRSRFFEFAFLKNVGDMPRYGRDIPTEERCNLGLRHPEGFTLVSDVELQPLVGSVDQKPVAGLFVLHQTHRIVSIAAHESPCSINENIIATYARGH